MIATGTDPRDEVRARLEGLLADANGKRRSRTLDLRALAGMVVEACSGDGCGSAHVGGMTVCNSYHYRAIRTVACARAFFLRKDDRRVAIAVGTGNAHGGACRPPALRASIPTMRRLPTWIPAAEDKWPDGGLVLLDADVALSWARIELAAS